ncbi:ATP-binding protein [Terrabacter sp. NPDC080008]|uniref:sensor histidine kinase n=1 Tax=Terrabacter sp. NPDC080008 TaxID=3155176 RepID=UPI00344B4BB8
MGQMGVPGPRRPGREVATSRILPTVIGWILGIAVTAAILGTPYLLFAYHDPQLHLILDSADTGVALLVAFLTWGRYRRSGRLPDLLLAGGLLLLAVAGLGLTLALHLLGLEDGRADVWLPVAIRVVGAVLVFGAAVVGPRRATHGWALTLTALPWATVALGLALAYLLDASLPVALAATPPASAERPVIAGHPALLAAHALTAACFAVASVLFACKAARRPRDDDELLRWLGPALALAAFARLNYVLFPSLYSGWLYTGDLLRTGSYAVLLLGAAREISRYWSAQARAAVLEDRRRLARELHDGVVQEIAYIRAETHTAVVDAFDRERIVAACDRALDEARAAIDALGRSTDEPLGFMLHRAARQVADRYHASLEVELDDSVHADDEQRHALVRITREAVSNAIRHGRAERVRLCLQRDDQRRQLLVRDEGAGFDPATVKRNSTGYGLTSMEERAAALRGSVCIDSAPGRGTTVAVTW